MKVQRRGANAAVIFIPETRNYASAIKNDNTTRDNKQVVISCFWGKCGSKDPAFSKRDAKHPRRMRVCFNTVC